jgi:hypothetical protein
MSQELHPPQRVKLIVGILSGRREFFEQARAAMEALWGAVDIQSDIWAFTSTNYYEKQMGTNLNRQFFSFSALIDPGELARIKHQSNAVESALAQSPAGEAAGVARPINLDPGYIDPGKLVLASTKNYSHRIYIGQSIYAEPTLHYHKGSWQTWPFTYPDYASGEYFDFLNQARKGLMEQLSSKKSDT